MDKFLIHNNSSYKYWKDYTPRQIIYGTEPAVPVMTSNNDGKTIIFGSSIWSSLYDYFKAFDRDTTTYYATVDGTTTGYIGCILETGKVIGKYSLTLSGTGTSPATAMPRDWKLYGSNDTTDGVDGTWELMDERIDQTWATTPNAVNTYFFENSTIYKALKFEFSKNNGHSTHTSFKELTFYEVAEVIEESASTWVDVSTSIPTKEQFEQKGMIDLNVLNFFERVYDPIKTVDVTKEVLGEDYVGSQKVYKASVEINDDIISMTSNADGNLIIHNGKFYLVIDGTLYISYELDNGLSTKSMNGINNTLTKIIENKKVITGVNEIQLDKKPLSINFY